MFRFELSSSALRSFLASLSTVLLSVSLLSHSYSDAPTAEAGFDHFTPLPLLSQQPNTGIYSSSPSRVIPDLTCLMFFSVQSHMHTYHPSANLPIQVTPTFFALHLPHLTTLTLWCITSLSTPGRGCSFLAFSPSLSYRVLIHIVPERSSLSHAAFLRLNFALTTSVCLPLLFYCRFALSSHSHHPQPSAVLLSSPLFCQPASTLQFVSPELK